MQAEIHKCILHELHSGKWHSRHNWPRVTHFRLHSISSGQHSKRQPESLRKSATLSPLLVSNRSHSAMNSSTASGATRTSQSEKSGFSQSFEFDSPPLGANAVPGRQYLRSYSVKAKLCQMVFKLKPNSHLPVLKPISLRHLPVSTLICAQQKQIKLRILLSLYTCTRCSIARRSTDGPTQGTEHRSFTAIASL